MILLALALYFLLFSLLAALLIFPPARLRLVRLAGQIGSGLSQASRTGSQRLVIGPADSIGSGARRLMGIVRRHRKLLLLTAAASLAPSLVVLSMGGRTIFDFSPNEDAPDRHIALLLEGERLSPPPALPPEVFTTREVELIRPAIAWGSRDWALLDDEFRQRLLTVFKLLRERHGYEAVLLEGFRSPERQAALAAMGSHVTQAAPGMSYHQYGLAADVAFLRDGRLVISEKDDWAMRGYELYGALADTAGLTWGGNWRMRDYGHVELRRPGVLSRQGQ